MTLGCTLVGQIYRSGRLKVRLAAGAGLIVLAGLTAPALAQSDDNDDGLSRPVIQQLPNRDSQNLNAALVRLGSNPRDPGALIDAGDAALSMGDADAAFGFYSRADQASPGNPRAKTGLAGALLRSENPLDAIPLFAQAERSGAIPTMIAADRGLAYDLVGDTVNAQQYYRQALGRGSNNEVLVRLALSQAIAGDARGSETTLAPLLQRRDKSAWRTRVFALAIGGKVDEAVSIANATLPRDLASAISPYLRYMPQLTDAQQAAAANFGHFPRASEIGRDMPRIAAYAATLPRRPALAVADAGLGPTGITSGRRSRSRRQDVAMATVLPSARSRPPDVRPGREVMATADRTPVPHTLTAREARLVAAAERRRERETAAASTRFPRQAAASAGVSAAVRSGSSAPAIPRPTPRYPVVAVATPLPARPVALAAPAAAAISPVARPAAVAPVGDVIASAVAPIVIAASPVARPVPLPEIALAAPAAPISTSSPPPTIAPGFDLGNVRTSAPALTLPTTAATAELPPLQPVTPAQAASAVEVRPTVPIVPPAPALVLPPATTPAPVVAPVPAPTPAPARRQSLAEAFSDLSRPSIDIAPAAGAVDIRRIADARPGTARSVAIARPAEAKPRTPPPPSHPSRIWVQVATGRDKAALAFDWRRMTRQAAEVLHGKQPTVSTWGQTNRLLTGPFPTEAAAVAFINQLSRVDVRGAFVWTSPAGQVVDGLVLR